jgi:putative hydrolase of the HAD superfamily
LPLYIVTDGNKLVQHRKLAALNLLSRVKRSFITHRFGIRHAKPSPYCFQRICALENTSPQQVIYIADNPVKDFVGIKPLGYKTIRVLTGQHKSTVMPPAFEADRQIHSLAELDWALINTII